MTPRKKVISTMINAYGRMADKMMEGKPGYISVDNHPEVDFLIRKAEMAATMLLLMNHDEEASEEVREEVKKLASIAIENVIAASIKTMKRFTKH